MALSFPEPFFHTPGSPNLSLARLDVLLRAYQRLLWDTRPEFYTISSGAITLYPLAGNRFVTLAGEGAAADALDTINGGGEGQRLVLQAADAANDITLTSSGNLNLGGFGSFVLGELRDKAEFIRRGDEWDALSLRNN